MAVEFDSFTATPFGEFVETIMGDRGAKASQLTDIIVNTVGEEDDFTPIIIIISNAIGQPVEDQNREQGYQNPIKLEEDLVGFGFVIDAFNRANWDGLGRIRPNLRVGIMQPQFVGNVTDYTGPHNIGQSFHTDEFRVQFNGGRRMLGDAFVEPLRGGVRIYYSSEFLTPLSAVDEFEGELGGPSLPGGGLLGLWDSMSNGGQFKMQQWWTQVGLDQYDITNQGQFHRGFVILLDGLDGPDVTNITPGHDPIPSFESVVNTAFPLVYWGNEEMSVAQWLVNWGNYPRGSGPTNVTAITQPLPGSRVVALADLAARRNGAMFPTRIEHHTIHGSNSYRWIRHLTSFIQTIFPGF